MGYEHRCVVDETGFYKAFVLVFVDISPETGLEQETVQYYKPSPGMRLIDAPPPALRINAESEGFIRPRWNETEWMEAADTEEIAAWESSHSGSEPPVSTLERRVDALEAETDAISAAIERGLSL